MSKLYSTDLLKGILQGLNWSINHQIDEITQKINELEMELKSRNVI